MNKLIYADVLIKDLEEYKVDISKAISEDELYINGYNAGLHTAICAIIEAAAVDVVPIVQCEKCKHKCAARTYVIEYDSTAVEKVTEF